MSSRSKPQTLSQWLDTHYGQVVQIGTKGGSGFLYAGKAGRFTLDAMRSAYHEDFTNAPVVDCSRSFYGGFIVLIRGYRSGSAELPRELMPTFPEAPIENYLRFADYWASIAAREYKTSLVSIGLGRGGTTDEVNVNMTEKFFRSQTFSVICQNADGEEIIRLIKKEARKEIEEHERRRKERSAKWLY